MTSTSSSGARSATGSRAEQKPVKHVHHGRTPAAWAGSMIALFAFLVGAIGIVLGPNWVVFWIAVALLAVALIVTAVLRKLGYGAD